MSWISVKERIPEYIDRSEHVVIVKGINDEGEPYVYWAQCHAYGEETDPKKVFSVPGLSNMNVSHWQELPEY